MKHAPIHLVHDDTEVVSPEEAARWTPTEKFVQLSDYQLAMQEIRRLEHELWVVAECIFRNIDADSARHWAQGIKVSIRGPDQTPSFKIEGTMKFTPYELAALEKHPDALRAAADYNDSQESEADACGADSSAEYHRARRLELVAEAERIEKENS